MTKTSLQRIEALLSEVEELKAENEKLKRICVAAINATDGFATMDVTTEFLSFLPQEVAAIKRQRNEYWHALNWLTTATANLELGNLEGGPMDVVKNIVVGIDRLRAAAMSDALKPSPALLCKLGSIIVHCEELVSDDGHEFDRIAMETLIWDEEVKQWMRQMGAMTMLPVKRKP